MRPQSSVHTLLSEGEYFPTERWARGSESPLPSSSTDESISKISSSVGFWPIDCSVTLSSLASIVPLPSASNFSKASRHASISSSVIPSAMVTPRRYICTCAATRLHAAALVLLARRNSQE